MKITKRQLKRIIREEYTKLARRGLIRESAGGLDPVLVEKAQWALQAEGEDYARQQLEATGLNLDEATIDKYLAEGAKALAAYWERFHASMGASYATGRDSRWSGD